MSAGNLSIETGTSASFGSSSNGERIFLMSNTHLDRDIILTSWRSEIDADHPKRYVGTYGTILPVPADVVPLFNGQLFFLLDSSS
jgi:hypothetical protein